MITICGTDGSGDFVTVILDSSGPRAPFSADARFAPEGGGYRVFVDLNATGRVQIAARAAAALGIRSLSVEACGFEFTALDGYLFALALDDLQHDCRLRLPLPEAEAARIGAIYEVVARCRSLADSSGSAMVPLRLVQRAYELIENCVDSGSLSFDVIARGHPEFDSFAGLKAVGAGSDQTPVMGIIDYYPDGQENRGPELCLVGKGITFDSGGYDLKPPKSMETMRTDKTGAINLAGALALAVRLGLKRRVRLYLCCAQNLVSPGAMTPGDVISYRNGVTVEIGNTDAEGRLVLADGLIAACESGARAVLTEATLTGAAKTALGRDMCAVVARGNRIPDDFSRAFAEAGEFYWQLPLYDFHDRFIRTRRADWCNTSHGEGAPGVSTAAAFLEKFVRRDVQWLHIDLSSAYLPEGSCFYAPGPTGATVCALGLWLAGSRLAARA